MPDTLHLTQEEIMAIFEDAEKVFCKDFSPDSCGKGMHQYLKQLFERRLEDKK
jgi:hypothetical protein